MSERAKHAREKKFASLASIRAAYIICALKFSMFRQSTSRLALGCFRTVSDEGMSEINKSTTTARLALSSSFPFVSAFTGTLRFVS